MLDDPAEVVSVTVVWVELDGSLGRATGDESGADRLVARWYPLDCDVSSRVAGDWST